MSREWTKEEVEFLEKYAYKGSAYCGKRLQRTDRSIWAKVRKLGISLSPENSPDLSAKDVAAIMGIHVLTVKDWIEKGYLQAKMMRRGLQKIYQIELRALETFLYNRQEIYDSRKMQTTPWLEEPDWFKEKRARDAQGFVRRNGSRNPKQVLPPAILEKAKSEENPNTEGRIISEIQESGKLSLQDLAKSIVAIADRVKEKFRLKNASYGGESALHNFEQTAIRFFGDASLGNCFKVGMILMDKHLVTLAKNGIHDKEGLDRLEDIVVYSMILMAMREKLDRH